MTIQHASFYAVNIIVHTAVYIFFILMPFKSKLRFGKKITAGGSFFYLLVCLSVILLFFERESPFKNSPYAVFFLLLWIAVTMACFQILIRAGIFKTFFIIILTFNIQNSIIVLARLITDLSHPPLFYNFADGSYLLISMLVLLAYIPIMWYLYIILFKKVIDRNIEFSYWKHLVLIPLSLFIFYHTSNFGGLPLDRNYTSKHLIVQLFLNVSAILTYSVALQMMLKTYESLKASQAADLISKQLEMQKKTYQDLTENIEKTARIQHDFRHHLLSISTLVKEKKMQELSDYLGDYLADMPEEEGQLCENHSVDIILRYYLALAKKSAIDFTVSVHIPQELSVSNMNLCVVFGNLIENAVTACQKQKEIDGTAHCFITTKAKVTGRQLFIFIENSFDSHAVCASHSLNAEKNQQSGIGLSSVREIAEKSGGNLKITTENNVFKAYVLIIF